MAPWLQSAPGFRRHGAAGYGGPWIENMWISHFEALAEGARARKLPLSAVFGPYIPLLLPFTDHWVREGGPNGYRYPAGFLRTLLASLRPSVAYIAVSQNDEGLTGKDELPMGRIPNVLVLSAGGYGHVPLPLLKQAEPSYRARRVSERALLVSYVGSLKNAPHDLRERMRMVVAASAADLSFRYRVTHGLFAHRWSAMLPPLVERLAASLVGAESWRGVMADSRASLCPRGYGRSSYHLGEAVQMGRVPIQVYSDVPWLPYARLFRHDLGFATDLAGLPQLLRRLLNTSDAELERRERAAASLRDSHFTLAGVVDQIGRFMVRPSTSDLLCQRLPASTRDG